VDTRSAAGQLIDQRAPVTVRHPAPRYEDLSRLQNDQQAQNEADLAQAVRDQQDNAVPFGMGHVVRPIVNAVADPDRRASLGRAAQRVGEWALSDQPVVPTEWIDAITPSNVRGAVAAAPSAVSSAVTSAPRRIGDAIEATPNALGQLYDALPPMGPTLGGIGRAITYGPFEDERTLQHDLDVARGRGETEQVPSLADEANVQTGWAGLNAAFIPGDTLAIGAGIRRLGARGAAEAAPEAANTLRPPAQTAPASSAGGARIGEGIGGETPQVGGGVLDEPVPQASGTSDARSFEPQASPDASSSGKGLGDMGNPVFYRGADSADPLDMQLPTRPGADQAVFFTNSQEEAGKFGSNIHHYHIPELDNLADVRWSDYDKDPIYTPEVMQRILADARSRGAAGVRIGGVQNFEHGPLTTTVALFNPEHAVPFESGAAQLSDGNALQSGRIGEAQSAAQTLAGEGGSITYEVRPDGWHVTGINLAEGAREDGRGAALYQQLMEQAQQSGATVLMGQRHAPGSGRLAGAVAGGIGGGAIGATLSGEAQAEDGSGDSSSPLLPILGAGGIGALLGARGMRSSVGAFGRPSAQNTEAISRVIAAAENLARENGGLLPTRSAARIAEQMGYSPSTVARILSDARSGINGEELAARARQVNGVRGKPPGSGSNLEFLRGLLANDPQVSTAAALEALNANRAERGLAPTNIETTRTTLSQIRSGARASGRATSSARPSPSAGRSGRQIGYDIAEAIRRLQGGESLQSVANAMRTAPNALRDAVVRRIARGETPHFELNIEPMRNLQGDYDAADFLNATLARDSRGRYPTLPAIAMDLRGDVDNASVHAINTQLYRLRAEAMAAAQRGEEAVSELAQRWNVTPARLREFVDSAGKRRGFSASAEARRLVSEGVTEPSALIKELRALADEAGAQLNDASLGPVVSAARRQGGLIPSRGTDTASAAAIGAGLGAGFTASNARADTGDGAAENDWPTIVGGGIGGAILGGLLARGHLGRTGARLGEAAPEARAATGPINQETYDAVRSSIAGMDGPEIDDLARTFGVDPNAVDRAHQIAARIAGDPEAVSAYAAAPGPRMSQSEYIASVRQSVDDLAHTEEFDAVAQRWGVDPDALDAPEQLTRLYLRSMPTPEAANFMEQASNAASAQFERLSPQQRLQVADQLGVDASAPDFAQQAGDHFTRPIHDADRSRLNSLAGPLAVGGAGAGLLLSGGEARAQDQENQIRPLPEGMDFREGNWLEPQWRQITLPDGSPGVERAILGPDRQPHIIVARQGSDASITVLGETSPSAGPPPPSAPRVGNHMEVRANSENAPIPRGSSYAANDSGGVPRVLGALVAGQLTRGLGRRLGAGLAARELWGVGGTYVGGRALGLDNEDALLTSAGAPLVGLGGDYLAGRASRWGGDVYTGLHNGATAQMTDRALLSDPEFLARRRAFMQTLPEEMPRARVSAGSDLEMGAFADQPATIEMDRRGNIVSGLSPYSEFAAASPTEQAVWMDRQGFEIPQDANPYAIGRGVQRRLGAPQPALPAPAGDGRGMPPMNRRTRGERTGPAVQRRAATRPAGQTMTGFIDAAARAGFTIPRGRSNAETARNIADAVRGNPRLEQLARDWGLSVLLAAGIGAGAASETRAEAPN